MGVPVRYRKGQESLNFTFDWFDFAAGAGYKTFHMVGGENDTAKIYFAASSALKSSGSNVETEQAGNGTTELNFDIEFERPVTIANANSYVVLYASESASTGSVNVQIYHVKNGAETSLGQEACENITSASGTTARTFAISTSKKGFGIGDILRFEVKITHSGGAGTTTLHHDPNGSYPFKVYVPFVIDA